jgi:hypothetical protein
LEIAVVYLQRHPTKGALKTTTMNTYTIIETHSKGAKVQLPCGKILSVGNPVKKSMQIYFEINNPKEKTPVEKVMAHLTLAEPKYYGQCEGWVAFDIVHIVKNFSQDEEAVETAKQIITDRRVKSLYDASVIAEAYVEEDLDQHMNSHPFNLSGTAFN